MCIAISKKFNKKLVVQNFSNIGPITLFIICYAEIAGQKAFIKHLQDWAILCLDGFSVFMISYLEPGSIKIWTTVRAVGKTIKVSTFGNFSTNVVVGDQNCAQCIEGSSPHSSTCSFLHLLEIFPPSSRDISSIFEKYFLHLREIFLPSSWDPFQCS